MASEVDLANVPLEFEYKGTTYKLARVMNQRMEQAFADWVYAEACRHAERQLALYLQTNGELGHSPQQHEIATRHIEDQAAMGEYDIDSRLVQNKRSRSWAGIKYELLLKFRAYHPNLTMKFMDDIFDNEKEKERLYAVLRPQNAGDDESENSQQKEDAPPASQPETSS